MHGVTVQSNGWRKNGITGNAGAATGTVRNMSKRDDRPELLATVTVLVIVAITLIVALGLVGVGIWAVIALVQWITHF